MDTFCSKHANFAWLGTVVRWYKMFENWPVTQSSQQVQDEEEANMATSVHNVRKSQDEILDLTNLNAISWLFIIKLDQDKGQCSFYSHFLSRWAVVWYLSLVFNGSQFWLDPLIGLWEIGCCSVPDGPMVLVFCVLVPRSIYVEVI